ncbi:DUF2768 family protein [Bacillaceae bacterium IKA-2]|jgi:hypothetical protein|nr:DUF2768 family protein [Bacillaceae bacterium IKA-2]
MSEGLIKMYVTFITMGLIFITVLGSIFARRKLTGIFQKIVLAIAFLCMIVAGLLTFLLVFNVPAV